MFPVYFWNRGFGMKKIFEWMLYISLGITIGILSAHMPTWETTGNNQVVNQPNKSVQNIRFIIEETKDKELIKRVEEQLNIMEK